MVGFTPFVFPGPGAIQPDPLRLASGVWIAHHSKLDAEGAPLVDGGAVSNLVIDSAFTGVQPLVLGSSPSLRGISFRIATSIGRDELTGVPLDLAFDDQVNLGASTNYRNAFSVGIPAPLNGKCSVRSVQGSVRPTSRAAYLFVPVRSRLRGHEAIDVIDLATGRRVDTSPYEAGVQSIPAPGARGVATYFRQ